MTAEVMPRRSNALTILTDDRIAIRVGASVHIVRGDDIMSVHASRNSTRIATRGTDIRVHLPFATVLDALRRFDLMRIHRGSAVNMSRVCCIVGRGQHRLFVVLDGGTEHSVGRGFQSAVRAHINVMTD